MGLHHGFTDTLQAYARNLQSRGRIPVVQTTLSDEVVVVGTLRLRDTHVDGTHVYVRTAELLPMGLKSLTAPLDPVITDKAYPVTLRALRRSFDPRYDMEDMLRILSDIAGREHCGAGTKIVRMADNSFNLEIEMRWPVIEPASIDEMEELFDMDDYEPVDHAPFS